MKKRRNHLKDDDMLPEYNFEGKKGVRGKYAKSLQQGFSIRILNEDGTVSIKHFVPRENENAIVLDPDVKAYFPDSASVNRALRSLIDLIPERRRRQIADKKFKYKAK